MTCAWTSKHCIALELSQIQPFSWYFDLTKCNLDESIKVAWVHGSHKCVAQSLGNYRLAELEGAQLVGWIDGSWLKKYFTHNQGVHGARKTNMPNNAQEEEIEVESVAGQKYISGQWMYLDQWKDWEKWSWVQAEDMARCKGLVDRWNATHWVPADHLSIQWWERLRGKWQGKGGDPLRRLQPKDVKIPKTTQLGRLARRRTNIKMKQLRRLARWRKKKYSYWLNNRVDDNRRDG